jgi:mannose/cellobiose epimerase-like protein (N-acyl-D-glucosamine 2-epimerase family)
MHLFEAALAWCALDADPGWRQMADGLVALCLEKMIEPASGALREFFAPDWTPAPGTAGRICEPGHHYEWAFLLDRWATILNRKKPEAVRTLIAFADAHGIDQVRGSQSALCWWMAQFTTRWPGCGRRQSAFAPTLPTAEAATRSLALSGHYDAFWQPRSKACGSTS